MLAHASTEHFTKIRDREAAIQRRMEYVENAYYDMTQEYDVRRGAYEERLRLDQEYARGAARRCQARQPAGDCGAVVRPGDEPLAGALSQRGLVTLSKGPVANRRLWCG